MEQALLELVSNALDAMPKGGTAPASRGRAERRAAVRRRSPIEVADTGGGIPDNVLPSVCEPFFTTREEGTGLGLAIAKRYVEQNGGRLEIASPPGAGTTVRVRLPAARSGGMSGTVLIVDDERTLARAVKAFLHRVGLRGGGRAGDAEQALGAARDAAARRGVLRRAASRHERNRAAAPDPGVRSLHPGHHHDRLRHHRRRGRGGQARRVRLPEEAGGSGGAEAAGRPRAGDTPSSSRSSPTTGAGRRARCPSPACSATRRPCARCWTRPGRSPRWTRRRPCSSPARPAPARGWWPGRFTLRRRARPSPSSR